MKKRIIISITLVCMVISVLAGCGPSPQTEQSTTSGTATASSVPAKTTDTAKDAGSKEITIMLPTWGEPSDADLKVFMDKTGITVKKNIMGWDEIRDKISIAGASNTAAADVIEFDWSWVGAFYSANWVEPLTLSDEDLKDMPVTSLFTLDGKILGVPYNNDFRVGLYNMDLAKKANITTPPVNWDEFIDQCVKIKAAGASAYPFNMGLEAAEATAQTLYIITLSRSGDFFNPDGTLQKENVLSNLKFLNDCVNKYKIVDTAASHLKDVEASQQFMDGATVFTINNPGFLGQAEDPANSKIVGKVAPFLVPGRQGVETTSIGLPEALAVSSFSKAKEAAIQYVMWAIGDEEQNAMFVQQGLFPTRLSTLKKLLDAGKVKGGEIVLKQAGTIKPIFPKGVPLYYAEMSATIYTSINQMVQGQITPEKAVDMIDVKIKELMAKG
jgi:multiple sugar transport system substrate-binding protein